jgi:hypothetical protein
MINARGLQHATIGSDPEPKTEERNPLINQRTSETSKLLGLIAGAAVDAAIITLTLSKLCNAHLPFDTFGAVAATTKIGTNAFSYIVYQLIKKE